MKKLLVLGALVLMAIPFAHAQFKPNQSDIKLAPEPLKSLTETSPETLDSLVKSAAVIIVAELIELSEISAPVIPAKNSSLLKRDIETKKVTEDRANSGPVLEGLGISRLKTIHTLKGPKTDILSLPLTDLDFESAQTGDLFLIMLGVQHSDAIHPITSMEDPWVKRIQLLIE